MTKFQLTEFLTWMTNHQPSSKQVLDEMYIYDVALVMQTVRDEFTRLQAERDEARVDQRLIDELWDRRTEMTDMNEQIKRLRNERDEARRESCVWGSRTEMGARSLAKFKGWDCYKEETQ